jgi:DNA-binding CsgD family transcriptional regulator
MTAGAAAGPGPAAAGPLEQGRDAYARHAWGSAYESLEQADEAAPLAAADLELLATSAFMLGRVDDFLAVLERAHAAHVEDGNDLRAARCAFFVGVNLALRGDLGQASGWFGRAQRLVDRHGEDCAERGYLLMPVAMRHEASGDYEGAYAAATEAAELGERFGDADLFSLAVHTQGLALIRQGKPEAGLALMDEAMLAATAGELSPIVTGVVYCGVIAGCEEAFEVRRAREWTDALSDWCERQPELVAFGGRCLAHRAEIMQLHGAWAEALEEARRARSQSERALNLPAAGQALYLQGEVHRLRGEHAEAENAYREAHRLGREPQPGLALLRLAQGQPDSASASVRRALAESSEPLQRARLLPAQVEIALALGALDEARSACAELDDVGRRFPALMLDAVASACRGAVELAEGDAQAALVSLRRSVQAWQELDAPYGVARARVLAARACLALGDGDTAELELDAARSTFDALGAARDSEQAAALARPDRVPHGLTPRELEVLRLVATGMSNRQIASALVVSEHTVARHVQNMFVKLRVSSRAAATAFAFEHGLT